MKRAVILVLALFANVLLLPVAAVLWLGVGVLALVILFFRPVIRLLRKGRDVPMAGELAMPIAAAMSPLSDGGRGEAPHARAPRLPDYRKIASGNVVSLNAHRTHARYTDPDDFGGNAA